MKLHPYQERGIAFLRPRKFALLADEMGLGKSAQAIRAAPPGPILVICPAIARTQWATEWARWSTRKTQVLLSTNVALPVSRDVVICSYAALQSKRFMHWVRQRAWSLAIVDECHYAKEVTAQRTKAIYGKEGIGWCATRLWALSGTPAPNHAGELWPMLYAFSATHLTYKAFLDRYCNVTPEGRVVGTKAAIIPELRQILDKVMLRRKKAEVLKDLPPISFHEVFVEAGDARVAAFLPGEDEGQLQLGEGALKSGLSDAGPDHQAEYLGLVAANTGNVRRYMALRKVEPVLEMILAELDAKLYERIIVFGHHVDPLQWLSASLRHAGVTTELVQGRTTPAMRDAAVARFQAGRSQVFIANIVAAGTAINLTAAHNVLFLEQSWVPGENMQAAMRAHRHGQDRPVFVRIAMIKGSVDEDIQRVLLRKGKELARLFR